MTSLDAPARQAGQRARGYWFLSRLLLEVPTAAMLSELQRTLAANGNEEWVESEGLSRAVAASLAEPDAAAIAFTRHLCLGDRKSGEPLPFEAHVREGCLPGESTRQVADAMNAAGYGEVAPEAASPDHLGAELRFMALLCHREYEAWSRGDRSGARDALRSQRRFLALHLSQWAPQYCRGLASRTSDEYLRSVAALTGSSVDEDVKTLDEICRWLAPDDLGPSATGRFQVS